MREWIVAASILVATGGTSGCGTGAGTAGARAPLEAACLGLSCGEPCCPVLLVQGACPVMSFAAATACDYAGRCGFVSAWMCYDPCAGKACGAPCHACPPDATDCAETQEVKVCDADRVCTSLAAAPPACP